MRFSRIKFKGKKRSVKGKGLGIGSEGVPLIELHRYSRLSEPHPDEEDYEWHATRSHTTVLNAPSRPSSTKKGKKKRRTKILNLIFPARLGDLATAWRLQIETANGTCIPVTSSDIVIPRPVYSVGRNRQRGLSVRTKISLFRGRSRTGGGESNDLGVESDVKDTAGLGKGTAKRNGSVKEKRKSKVRFVLEGEDAREAADVHSGNGEGSSKSSRGGTDVMASENVSELGRATNCSGEVGGSTTIKGWAQAAEFGLIV